MPRQNRVDPFGEVVRTAARGTLMGNRGGCFHDERQELTRSRWQGRRWIACVLEFRGRWRPVMQPQRYTELFFLDEATALSAGHRPCAQCRWADFQRFKTAWLAGNPACGLEPTGSIDAIDVYLHRDRVDRLRQKVSYRERPAALPDGAMIALDASPGQPYLVYGERLYLWSFEGYSGPCDRPATGKATVLTPRSIVNAIANGYAPSLHPSLAAMLR